MSPATPLTSKSNIESCSRRTLYFLRVRPSQYTYSETTKYNYINKVPNDNVSDVTPSEDLDMTWTVFKNQVKYILNYDGQWVTQK